MKTGDYIDHNGYRYELQYIGVGMVMDILLIGIIIFI